MKFTRRDAIRTGAGAAAGLIGTRLLGSRAFAPEEAIALGALVELESADKTERVLICSGGGGLTLDDDQGPLRIVTPDAPLARALLGKTSGDEVELVVAGRKRELVIASVA